MNIHFDDLLRMRFGGAQMTMGRGPTVVEPILTLQQWELKATALRELYRWVLGSQPTGYDLPLDLRIESEDVWEGLRRRTVSYMVGPDERIKAYVMLPADISSPRPAVLAIHPTCNTGREMSIGNDPDDMGRTCAYGVQLAQRGYVTISADIDSSHDRQYGGCESFGNEPFYFNHPEWSARGKDIYDVSRAIDVLEQMPEVDKTRIGSIGHSQGGGITVDGMALEPRIKAGVCNCGDWPLRLSKNPYNVCRTGWWIGLPRLRPFALCGKDFPIDLHEKLALSAPRPLMMLVSLVDFQWEASEEPITRSAWQDLGNTVKRVYDLYQKTGTFELVLHTKGHVFEDADRAAAYAFLDKHLLTAN